MILFENLAWNQKFFYWSAVKCFSKVTYIFSLNFIHNIFNFSYIILDIYLKPIYFSVFSCSLSLSVFLNIYFFTNKRRQWWQERSTSGGNRDERVQRRIRTFKALCKIFLKLGQIVRKLGQLFRNIENGKIKVLFIVRV